MAVIPLAAAAQSGPAPSAVSPSPAPSPESTPNAIGPALGANDPCTTIAAIVTRPSVTNSVCTVRPNHVLIETGYQNTSFQGGGNAVTYPQPLIRMGTKIPALELDIAPPGISRTNAGGMITGTTDVGAGLKYVFGYTPKFNYGGQAFFTAPTGLNGFSAEGGTSSYALNAGYTLSPVFSLAATVTAQSLTNGAQRWQALVPSLVLGASLPNATGVGAEIAQFTHANGPGTPTRTQYLASVYRDLGQRIQLDASYAFSPTAATGRYHAVGFGASFYF
ncbi:MAG: hypothetical protein JWM87_3234 [Candidatus Eremiobacteraeota bacterium]|nr:hypothetical protein [Candidatus Eremiobacteraeota bacterium]